MAWLDRLRNVVQPGRLHRDLEDELAFHLRERCDQLEADGMTPAEAARTARLQFGTPALQLERTRDMDIHQHLDNTLRNLRHAARALARSPGFTATVVATLALGIGANSAVFSAIYAVLLRPLPLPNPDRLVTLSAFSVKARQIFIAPVRLEDWNRLNSTFSAISGYYVQDESELSGELPERLTRALVAPRFLQVWGVAPALGRDFAPNEEHFGGPPAVLISDRLWRRRFAADPHVIGKLLRFNGNGTPIIGVMPASFVFPDRGIDLWSPSPNDAPIAQGRDLTWYTGIGRLKPGVTLAQALADLNTVQANLGRQFPKTDAQLSAAIKPLAESSVAGVRSSLWILFGSVTLLLLIACTNVAALLLARAAARRQEIAVRFSLGATRASVVAHLLAEVLILAFVGAALGLILASSAAEVFRSLGKSLPRVEEIALDWRIVLYSMGCAVVATLICGIVPALHGTRRDLAGATRGGRATVSGGNRVQLGLVGVQVALAVTLLAGAALLVRSLQELGRVSPGFDAGHVLTFHISSSWSETTDFKASRRRVERILDRLSAVPGVRSVATSISLPGLSRDIQVSLHVQEGRAATEPDVVAQARVVTPSYFATLQIPLLAGDLCRDDPGVPATMVNRAFANSYFPGSSPIGRHLSQPGSVYVPGAVVRGIVGDARETGIEHEPSPAVYWCVSPGQPGTHYLVRTLGEPVLLADTIRRKMREIEPRRSVYDLTPLADRISDAYATNRLRTILLVFFACAAMLLACVGLYGTIGYVVRVRQREVGLRLALGALPGQIVRHFLSQGLLVAALGCAAGTGLALASTRLLSGMLYGVSANDPAMLAGVVTSVLAVSALASLYPSVRASRLDPIEVLRED
jgi:predicted permease